MEALTNEVMSYIPEASAWNGVEETKELTAENVVESIVTVARDTAKNGAANAVTGRIAEKIVPTPDTPKPKKLIECFTSPYAKASHAQTIIQADLISGYRLVAYIFERDISARQTSVMDFYLDKIKLGNMP